MKLKKYKCKECGFEKKIKTNHYGECYSLANQNKCKNFRCRCSLPTDNKYRLITVWICQ